MHCWAGSYGSAVSNRPIHRLHGGCFCFEAENFAGESGCK